MYRSSTSQLAIIALIFFHVGPSSGHATATPSENSRAVATSATASFEEAEPGPFDRLETAIGSWTPEVGRTIVDDKHAKTGKHCLQLNDGRACTITLRTTSCSGGIDEQELLPSGTPEDVRAEVVRMCDIMAPGGGYFVGSTHNFQEHVPTENILAMYEAAREWRYDDHQSN